MTNATSSQTMKSATLHVKGMTCAACVNHVTEALLTVPAIENAQVSLATDTAIIEYQSPSLNIQTIQEAVQNAGYSIDKTSLIKNDSEETTSDETAYIDAYEARHAARIKELKLTRARAITGVAVGAIIMTTLFLRPYTFISNVSPEALNLIFMILATPVQFWAAAPFYNSAWAAAKRRTSNMNTLVIVGTSVAYAYSTFITIAQIALSTDTSTWATTDNFTVAGHGTGTYFEASAAIIGLVSLGRWLEGRTRILSSQALRKLAQLQPRTALVETSNRDTIEKPIEKIETGEIVILRPGERVPVDGEVVEGITEIDESMITGESATATKSLEDQVYAGTQNLTGSLRVATTHAGTQTLLAQIVQQVERAQASRAPIERLVDRVSAKFVPFVLITATAAFFIWLAIAPEPQLQNALLMAVTVTVIACPCALGLATPTAIVAGIGRAAEMGALFKNATAMEKIADIDTVIFDKTGTLTQGKPQVSQVSALQNSGMTENKILEVAAAAETPSEHPIAYAIVNEAKKRNIQIPLARNFRSIPGQGVFAEVNGATVSVSNTHTIDPATHHEASEIIDTISAQGETVVIVSIEGSYVGAIALSDAIRTDAITAVQDLHNMSIQTHILTGDKQTATHAVAEKLGVTHFSAELLPTEKTDQIQQLNKIGRNTAMAGDGINDGPALATANVGIAMASGTDIAMQAAEITLTNNQPSTIPHIIKLGKTTSKIIRQNLVWAFIYNILLIPVAAGALYPIFADSQVPALLQPIIGENGFLNPVAAAGAMAFSSLSVSINSLRLRKFK